MLAVVGEGLALAQRAAGLEEAPVHLDEADAARAAVEAVHVLRDEQEAVAQAGLRRGERQVAGVRLDGLRLPPPLGVEAPDEPGVLGEPLGGRHLLDRVALPEAVRVAEGGDAALGGDAGPGQDEQVACGRRSSVAPRNGSLVRRRRHLVSDEEATVEMRPIGFVRSPHRDKADIPKGPGAEHHAEGTLELRPELEAGLQDIEGFSHLFVLWVFDRSEGYELVSQVPLDLETPHGVFASRSPRRPNADRPVGRGAPRPRGPAPARARAWTCSTARPSSTSSRTCPACRPRSCGAAGSPRRKSAGSRKARTP